MEESKLTTPSRGTKSTAVVTPPATPSTKPSVTPRKDMAHRHTFDVIPWLMEDVARQERFYVYSTKRRSATGAIASA
jgi:hypothetical protein